MNPNPNIWSLPRHPEIRHLLLLLTEQLGEQGFVIDTVTPVDARAIYLLHRDDAAVRAYLYTHAQQPGRYGVHLEYPQSMELHENVALTSLVAMLAVHFDIAVIRPLPHEDEHERFR